jgi:hypothetical protein
MEKTCGLLFLLLAILSIQEKTESLSFFLSFVSISAPTYTDRRKEELASDLDIRFVSLELFYQLKIDGRNVANKETTSRLQCEIRRRMFRHVYAHLNW